MSEKIKVVMLEPGKEARIEEIEHTLENLQRIVGGLIEALYPFDEAVCFVANDSGKIDGLPLNRAVREEASNDIIDIIAGTCFICDCSGEDFGSLTDEQCERFRLRYQYPEHFVRTENGIMVIPYIPRTESI